MYKDFLKGFRISLGFIFGLSLFFGLVYAVGFHNANEVLSGTFSGNYSFMNGNVGIGTSSPTSALDVNGSINATSFIGEGSVPSGAMINFNTTSCSTGWTSSTVTSSTTDLVPTMTSNSAPSGLVFSSDEGGNPAWNAFADDGISTGWATSSSLSFPVTIGYNFTSEVEVISYKLSAMGSSFEGNPTSWSFQGLNSSGSWITIDSVSGLSWSTSEVKIFNVSSPGSYLGYRFSVPSHGWPWMGTGEIEFFGVESVTCIKN